MQIYLKISCWEESPESTGHYFTDSGKMFYDKELKGWFSKKEHIIDVNAKPVGDLDFWFKPITLK